VNYLTNYYKNLSEQLEAKCNQLINEIQNKKMLAEAWTPPPTVIHLRNLRSWTPGQPLPEGWTQEQIQNFQRWWKSLPNNQQDEFLKDWERSAPDNWYGQGWRWSGPIPIPPTAQEHHWVFDREFPEGELGPQDQYWRQWDYHYDPGTMPSIIIPGKR
jgi:hypothetical protein